MLSSTSARLLTRQLATSKTLVLKSCRQSSVLAFNPCYNSHGANQSPAGSLISSHARSFSAVPLPDSDNDIMGGRISKKELLDRVRLDFEVSLQR